ncbi:MAG: DUF4623 domain-containing protein [Planctomycetes bacterium]|nr:DUF4623 domain-containing protein [Planctomycetota bacterium]
MPLNRRVLFLSAATMLTLAGAKAQASLVPLPGFGSNGWLAPGSTPYLTTGNTERGLAYNPVTGNLVLVARQNVGGISNNIRVLDGATGADLFGLDNTGLTGGTFVVNMCDIDESGAIYACNLSTSAASPFKVYVWPSEAVGQVAPAFVAYAGVSGVDRTGDSFAVTGGGSSPAQFAAAGSNATSASNFVVGTLDSTNVSTAHLSVPGTTVTSNDYRLGLTWVDSSTLIGNQGANARVTSLAGGIATVTSSIPLGVAARRALDYTVIGGRPVVAVIDSNTSQVTVLDITDPTLPLTLATGNNTTGTLAANANGTGAVTWGPVVGNTALLYAMSSNQGVQAFLFNLPPASATTFGTGCDGLQLDPVGLPTVGNSNFRFDVSNLQPVSPIGLMGFGSVAINPGVDLTVIGMPGCFAYQTLDIGLFTTGPSIAGTAAFPLAIPANASLAGASLAAQGLGFTLSTPATLSTSNGLLFVVGF